MIRFHFFEWPIRAKLRRCCHVYSTKSREELRAWGRENVVPDWWFQDKPGKIPHFDLWGSMLHKCKGTSVTDKEFVADMRQWRAEHPETEKGAKR